ncbi:hypothetical protein [Lacrimispora sp. JR3]|uniref:hypothetical protein n=1 Tax=Lacrimispora sinapis TaxID=3111456 RepID=UPI003748330E
MIRQIRFEDGKSRIAEGIRSLCRALSLEGGILVKGTYCFSAAEVAKELEGEDLFMNQGIRLACAAISEINEVTGCGTRETARMMGSLLSVCERKAASGINPVFLAKDLKQAADSLEAAVLNGSFFSGKSKGELIGQITRDPETARMILKGTEAGELVVKESMYADTRLQITRGMHLDGPLTVGESGTFSEVLVLIVNRPLSSFGELVPLLQKLGQQKLFILADQIEGEALSLLSANVKKDRLHVWAMKAPGIGRRKEDIMGDVAVLTDTRVFDGMYPCSIEEIPLQMLGKANVLTAAGTYTVIEGDADRDMVRNRIVDIKKKIGDPKTNYYDKQKLRERLAALNGTAPVLYAGGDTLSQSKEEKRRIEYAVAYAQTIERYGIYHTKDLLSVSFKSEAEKMLAQVISKSLDGEEISTWLLVLMLRKVCGLMVMWLTTGAVMVSTGYDREDLELIKNGVDIERLRG